MSNEPNPFAPGGRPPWTRIYFGGVLCRAALTKIDGVSTEDEWKEQQSKETSGKVQVFSGTKKGKPKLTFLCTTEDEYTWLQSHWEMLKPVPTAGGGGAGTGATPKAPTGGTAYASPIDHKPGAVGSPTSPAKADAADDGASKSTGKNDKSNPGPRPPTISVEYPSLLRHGITAVARAKWDDKGFTATNGYEVEIEYVAQDPPKPAGGGALAPAASGPQGFAGAAQQRDASGNPAPAGGGAGGSGGGSPAAAQAAGT